MTKKIAIYGSYEAKVPVKQRYKKRRKDGFVQRYWKKTKRLKKVKGSGRYEFSGKGSALYKAVVKAQRVVPKGFIDVPAEQFLKHPRQYGEVGEWVEKPAVES